MIDQFVRIFDAATHAASLLANSAASVNPWWLVVGTLLYFAGQAVRTRGWHTILRTTYPDATQLRARDTCAAYLAGAGLNAIIPARGGDAVKLALVHRRVPEARYATLAATFIPETVPETIFGIGLVIWALARGFLPVPTTSGELPTLDVSVIVAHPILSAIVAGTLAVGGLLLWRVLLRRGQAFLARIRQGLAILGSPRRMVTGVASWQVLGRVVRLGSLAAFMAAFHLPVTVNTAVLVMAAQGGGRIIPVAPVSAGLRLAMLSYGFIEVTGQPVDIAAITTFTFGVSAILLVVGLLISGTVLVRELGTWSPREAVAAARRTVEEASRRRREATTG